MISPRLFPSLIIVLNLLAAATYACHGFPEWRKVIYWLAAATLTAVVTF